MLISPRNGSFPIRFQPWQALAFIAQATSCVLITMGISSTWGVSTIKGENAEQRIYLHVLKLKPGEPIVFDPRISWAPFLFGKPAPLKLTRKKNVLELELPRDALSPIDTIVVLHPESSAKGR